MIRLTDEQQKQLKEVRENRHTWYSGMGQVTRDIDFLLSFFDNHSEATVQGCQGAGVVPTTNGIQVINCKTCGRDWASLRAFEKHECVMRIELIYWLLRAYQSGHREGWESGPSVAETMDRICDVLSNAGYDPNSDKAKGLLQEFQEQSVKSQGEM